MPENDLMYIREGNFTENLIGWQDYNDLATRTTPVNLTTADTWYNLPNDGEGQFTELSHRVLGKSNVWDVETDSFNFRDLFVGGMHFLRTSVLVEAPSSNTEILARLKLGVGNPQGLDINIPLFQRFLKKGNTQYQISDTSMFTIGSEITRDYPAKIQIQSDTSNTEVVVEGWRIITVDRF